MSVPLCFHYTLCINIHRHFEIGVAERFLDRLHVLSVGFHQCAEAVPQSVPAYRCESKEPDPEVHAAVAGSEHKRGQPDDGTADTGSLLDRPSCG